MGSVGQVSNSMSEEQRKARLSELKEAKSQVLAEAREFMANNFDESGYAELTPEQYNEWNDITQRRIDIQFEQFNLLKPLSEEKYNATEGKVTDLNANEVAIARKDLLRNKDIYTAIEHAAAGTGFSENRTNDTEIDKAYKANPDKVYNNFKATRAMLKKKYGDTLTLYRAGTKATAKPTINMTSLKSNAQQYGDIYGTRVETIKVPVKDVLAVNVSRNGKYEEFIVLQKGHKK